MSRSVDAISASVKEVQVSSDQNQHDTMELAGKIETFKL